MVVTSGGGEGVWMGVGESGRNKGVVTVGSTAAVIDGVPEDMIKR